MANPGSTMPTLRPYCARPSGASRRCCVRIVRIPVAALSRPQGNAYPRIHNRCGGMHAKSTIESVLSRVRCCELRHASRCIAPSLSEEYFYNHLAEPVRRIANAHFRCIRRSRPRVSGHGPAARTAPNRQWLERPPQGAGLAQLHRVATIYLHRDITWYITWHIIDE